MLSDAWMACTYKCTLRYAPVLMTPVLTQASAYSVIDMSLGASLTAQWSHRHDLTPRKHCVYVMAYLVENKMMQTSQDDAISSD